MRHLNTQKSNGFSSFVLVATFLWKFYVFIVRPFLKDPSDHNTDPSFPFPTNFRQSTVEPQYNEMPREQ